MAVDPVTDDIEFLSDRELAEFVGSHLAPGKGTEEAWAVLSSPAMTSRTRAALAVLLSDVNTQLAVRSAEFRALPLMTRKDYAAARAEHFRWRAGALRFKGRVERRALQVKQAATVYREARCACDAGCTKAREHRRSDADEAAVRRLIGRHRHEFGLIPEKEQGRAGLPSPRRDPVRLASGAGR